tara:strand:- start:1709 stop:2599 length:891 start_codon:yes stop_codon:yes gene_type:complete
MSHTERIDNENNKLLEEGYTKTLPKKWTAEDVELLKKYKKENFKFSEISNLLSRSEVSIRIKWKRINKKNNTYNKSHLKEKYVNNLYFISGIKPKTILDVYAGKYSYYQKLEKKLTDINQNFFTKIITNDKSVNKDDGSQHDYKMDALKLLCYLYYKNKNFDLIDLDPFGSAYESFDLAIKMAKKGIIITYGEIGHKRFKRLDFVKRFYNIKNLKDFTKENLICKTQEIGLQNKKNLKPKIIFEARNILRVYYQISEKKIDIRKNKEILSKVNFEFNANSQEDITKDFTNLFKGKL